MIKNHRGRFLAAPLITILTSLSFGHPAWAQAPPGGGGSGAAKLPHPPVVLLDTSGQSVLKSKKPISTRRSCGGCHDYAFISSSMHSLMGRDQMVPVLLAEHGLPPFSASPGMFGKYSIISNRQMARRGSGDASDFDMGTPDWIRVCGACHPGGGASELDALHRRYDEVSPEEVGPLDPDYSYRGESSVETWDWAASGVAETDCFLCHIPNPDRATRKSFLVSGKFGWASTATLQKTGIVQLTPSGELVYNASAFGDKGEASREMLKLGQPAVPNCGQCHGLTGKQEKIWPLDPGEVMRCTEKAGWVFSGEMISECQQPEILCKDALHRPWDIHAAKGLSCIDCHFSPNNPGRRVQSKERGAFKYRPENADPAVYLVRPDHNLTRGAPSPQTVGLKEQSTMRECGDCHDTSKTHGFLPYKKRHFAKLTCRVCHIPQIPIWGYRSIDWSFLSPGDRPRITYRGISGGGRAQSAPVEGYLPSYVAMREEGSRAQIRPANLIAGLIWFDMRKRRPVFVRQLSDALFVGGAGERKYRWEVLRTFDADRDGKVGEGEAACDTQAKLETVRWLLHQYGGVLQAEPRLQVIPWSMSHSIAPGRNAIRDCRTCHGRGGILHRNVEVADRLLPGVRTFYFNKETGLVKNSGDSARFEGASLLGAFYVMGHDRSPLVEGFGWGAVAAAVLLCAGHLAARFFTRGRP